MTPKGSGDVSYVIPCFNGADFIAEAISSILAQSPDVREIILVDDGSTDGTAQIAQASGDQRLRVITQINSGTAVARNAGLRVATGEFIALFDSDDIAPLGRDAAMLAAFKADPTLDAAFGTWRNFWIDAVKHEAADPANASLVGLQASKSITAGLIRASAFDRFGEFDETGQSLSLVRWLLRAEKSGMKSRQIEVETLQRRIHTKNLSRQKTTDDLFDIFKLMKNKSSPQQA